MEDGSVIPLVQGYGVPLLTPSEAEALTTDNYSEEDLKEIKALAEFTSSGVTKIFTNAYYFAAVKDDGSSIVWEDLERGGEEI